MKLLRLSILGLFILLVVFGIYINTYYRSLFNTLDPKPGNELINFNTIDDDLSDKTNYFSWLGQAQYF